MRSRHGTTVSGGGGFVAIAGPSGSGKDAVLLDARARLGLHSTPPCFARRVITRPSSVGEDHLPVTEAEFDAAAKQGEYALAWRAHGLRYGIPRDECAPIASGSTVVANLSREVLPVLPGVFERPYTVLITVSPEIRQARIAARGRELGAEAAARIARPDPAPEFPYDLTIVNDGTIEDAGSRLAGFLASVMT